MKHFAQVLSPREQVGAARVLADELLHSAPEALEI